MFGLDFLYKMLGMLSIPTDLMKIIPPESDCII